MSDVGELVVTQGFYVRPRYRNYLVLHPAILTVVEGRMRLVDHKVLEPAIRGTLIE